MKKRKLTIRTINNICIVKFPHKCLTTVMQINKQITIIKW